VLVLVFVAAALTAFAKADDDRLDSATFNGLKFRSIGPALTSGRISDLAVRPDNKKMYYAATASGGLWKTVNAGTTWSPIFDSESSHSIGCVTFDPNDPRLPSTRG